MNAPCTLRATSYSIVPNSGNQSLTTPMRNQNKQTGVASHRNDTALSPAMPARCLRREASSFRHTFKRQDKSNREVCAAARPANTIGLFQGQGRLITSQE